MEMDQEQLVYEIKEKEADLQAFMDARKVLYDRVLASIDHSKTTFMPIQDWAGTHAVMNALDVFIPLMERTVDELRSMAGMPSRVEELLTPKVSIPSIDERPSLRLVKDEE